MNDPISNNQQSQTGNQPIQSTPATPATSGWVPQAAPTDPVVNTQPASPFEASPIPNITGPSSPPQVQEVGPVMMEPASPKSSTWLYVVLAVLLIGGFLFLAAFMKWIPFDELLGIKQKTPAPVVTPVANTPIANKDDATRKTDLANLKTALQKYYNDKQSYPISVTLSKTSDLDTPLKVLVPAYMPSLPLDPLSPNSFYGYKSTDGKTFQLSAALEDRTDPSGQIMGTSFLYIVTDGTAETPSTSNPTAAVEPTIIETPVEANIDITTDSSTSTSTSGSADASASASSDSSIFTN